MRIWKLARNCLDRLGRWAWSLRYIIPFVKTRGDAVVHASCSCHCRREFAKIRDPDPLRCNETLDLIGSLYAEEETIRKKRRGGREKLLWRQDQSRPIVEAFWRWCDAIVADMTRLPKNPLLTAIAYARNHRSGLAVCLQDPDVPIDTSHVERCVRPLALKRRNRMFAWSKVGAESVGIRQNLVSTCRLHGIDPYAWLIDVLQPVSTHPPGSGFAAATPVEEPLCRQPDDIQRPQSRSRRRCCRQPDDHRPDAASGLPASGRSQNVRIPWDWAMSRSTPMIKSFTEQ